MNCQVVQRRLLGTENPALVPVELRDHLADCSSCQEWRSQLLLIERHVPLLPIPRSRGKARLLFRILQAGEKAPTVAGDPDGGSPVPRLALRPGHRFPGWSRVPHWARGVAAAAAIVLCLLVGWLAFRAPPGSFTQPDGHSRPAEDPLVAALLQCDLRLAKAASSRERLELLTELAQILQEASPTLVQADADADLESLARLYKQVVHDGILPQALGVPAAERRLVLRPVAERLSRTERMAERLGQRVPVACGKPLLNMAAAAREGHLFLHSLLTEGKQ
jgi:hypothetical protein